MECPNCGLFNPPAAQRCDCGFDFPSQTVKDSFVSKRELRALATDPYAQYGGLRALGLFVRLFFWLHGRISGETKRRSKLEQAYKHAERFGPPEE